MSSLQPPILSPARKMFGTVRMPVIANRACGRVNGEREREQKRERERVCECARESASVRVRERERELVRAWEHVHTHAHAHAHARMQTSWMRTLSGIFCFLCVRQLSLREGGERARLREKTQRESVSVCEHAHTHTHTHTERERERERGIERRKPFPCYIARAHANMDVHPASSFFASFRACARLHVCACASSCTMGPSTVSWISQ